MRTNNDKQVNIENLIARNYNDFEIKIATRNFKPNKSFLFIENIKNPNKNKENKHPYQIGFKEKTVERSKILKVSQTNKQTKNRINICNQDG